MMPYLLGQVPIDSGVFVQYGIIGLILYWFMFRLEKKLDKHSSVLNDFTEIIAIDVLSRENLNGVVRTRAEKVLERTQARAHSSSQNGDVQ